MSDTPADPPKPPRVLPRAARLSQLTPTETPPETPTVGTPPPAPRSPAAPPASVPDRPVPPVPVVPAPVVPAPVVPAPVVPAPVVPVPVPPDPVPPAAAPPDPVVPDPVVLSPIGAGSSDVVDLARVIANASRPPTVLDTAPIETPSASGPGASGPSANRSLDSGLALRSAPTTSYAPAPGQSSGPVKFKPLVDPWANRSVIIGSFGLVLCFFPVLALAGLVMGAISLRRISTSGGSLIGARTARFGVILGGAGLAIGMALGAWFLATQ